MAWNCESCEITNNEITNREIHINHEDENWDSGCDLQKSITQKKQGESEIKTGKKQNHETDCAKNETTRLITQETAINIQSSGGA